MLAAVSFSPAYNASTACCFCALFLRFFLFLLHIYNLSQSPSSSPKLNVISVPYFRFFSILFFLLPSSQQHSFNSITPC